MSKISIITLGCKVNQYESDSLKHALVQEGFEVSTKLEYAEYYIINTCAVTNEGEHKSREQISKIIKLNPNAKIYICGCSSELHPESFAKKQNVEYIVGTENKLQLIQAIKNQTRGISDLRPSAKYFDCYSSEPSKTRSYIKIQDGCNNFCSYCIIPFTRGRERSRPLSSIKKEVKRLSSITKEIVLVGINIASYGRDLRPEKNLIDVVNIFKDHPEIRFRFSSFEMGTLTPELLQTLKDLPNFCPFFHISLQSACDNVLKKMNRHHNFNDYENLVNNIRSVFPNAGISTDIISGFPTETEDDHNEGVANIKKINFSNIHVFPYSSREGTVASKLPQINGTIIKARAREVQDLAHMAKSNYIKNNLNSTHEVLIEEFKNGYYMGYTKNYIKTYIKPTSNVEVNKIYKVILKTHLNDGAVGEIINEV